MQRRYVFFPRVRRGRERNLFSPLVTIRSFNREQTSPRSSGEFAFLEGSPSPGERMYFTKAIRTREIYLIERKSYFLRRVASSNRVSPLGSPNRNAKFRVTSVSRISLAYEPMFRRSSLSRSYFEYCTRMREYAVVFRFIDSFR